jgi:hypothetical protein
MLQPEQEQLRETFNLIDRIGRPGHRRVARAHA